MRMSLNPFRGARRKHEDPELNLIPMIDIMSVMVAFLLIYSTEVEVVQNAKDVRDPALHRRGQARRDGGGDDHQGHAARAGRCDRHDGRDTRPEAR